jgi:hypothetical protein
MSSFRVSHRNYGAKSRNGLHLNTMGPCDSLRRSNGLPPWSLVTDNSTSQTEFAFLLRRRDRQIHSWFCEACPRSFSVKEQRGAGQDRVSGIPLTLETDHQLLSSCCEDVLRKVNDVWKVKRRTICSTPTSYSIRTSACSSNTHCHRSARRNRRLLGLPLRHPGLTGVGMVGRKGAITLRSQ